jgi:hypothetical protein
MESQEEDSDNEVNKDDLTEEERIFLEYMEEAQPNNSNPN